MTPEHERLAAEYVIGLLDGDERRSAERLAENDPRFQEQSRNGRPVWRSSTL